MRKASKTSILGWLLHRLLVIVGAGALTLTVFLVLPILQAINKPLTPDTMLTSIDTSEIEPPPEVQEEPEEPEEAEEQPPQLETEVQPLTLDQLNIALGDSIGGGVGGAGAMIQEIASLVKGKGGFDEIASLADLDQQPRATYKVGPKLTDALRRRGPGTVYVIFIVDKDGRVQSPKVQKSTDPIFNRPAIDAVMRWRFEPGKRKGQPVSFRMRVPFRFPKG